MVKPKWMDIPIKLQRCTTRFKDSLHSDYAVVDEGSVRIEEHK